MTAKCRDWTSPATKTGGWEEGLNVLEGLTVLWWVTPIINSELPITIFHRELPLTVRFFEVNVKCTSSTKLAVTAMIYITWLGVTAHLVAGFCAETAPLM